jgi:hypothetical protein
MVVYVYCTYQAQYLHKKNNKVLYEHIIIAQGPTNGCSSLVHFLHGEHRAHAQMEDILARMQKNEQHPLITSKL